MLFSSSVFLFLFLPIVLILYFNHCEEQNISQYYFARGKFVFLCVGRTGLCSFNGGFHCCKLADRTCNGRKWSEENMAGFVGCMEFIPDVCF